MIKILLSFIFLCSLTYSLLRPAKNIFSKMFLILGSVLGLLSVIGEKYTIKIANYLTSKLSDIPELILPEINTDFSNVYYTYPIILNKNFKVDRNRIIRYLKNKNIPGFRAGYWNLHLLPMFQKKIAYGKGHYPWKWGRKTISYRKGICPNAENLNDKYFIGFGISNYNLEKKDIDFISYHFHKIFKKKY